MVNRNSRNERFRRVIRDIGPRYQIIAQAVQFGIEYFTRGPGRTIPADPDIVVTININIWIVLDPRRILIDQDVIGPARRIGIEIRRLKI